MSDLDALSEELKRTLPPFSNERSARQRMRLRADPRARIRRPGLPVRSLALALAVGAAALAGLAFVSLRSSPAVSEVSHRLSAETSLVDHVLDDGTRVTLSPGAAGTLSDRRDARRFVLDKGMASFDVVPNKAQPFTVLAGKYTVVVLGTRFSVFRPVPGAIRVVVERGSVSVSEAGQPAIRLGAGDRFEQNIAPARPSSAEAPSEPSAPAGAPSASAAKPDIASPVSSTAAPGADWHRLYGKRDFAGALAAARQHGLARLTEELGPTKLADLADVARLGGDPPAAVTVLRALERRFPGTNQARQAKFLLGRVLSQLGRSGEARAYFERYLDENPGGTYSTEAIGRLMDLYAKQGDTPRARRMAERYLERAPDGPYQALARSLVSDR